MSEGGHQGDGNVHECEGWDGAVVGLDEEGGGAEEPGGNGRVDGGGEREERRRGGGVVEALEGVAAEGVEEVEEEGGRCGGEVGGSDVRWIDGEVVVGDAGFRVEYHLGGVAEWVGAFAGEEGGGGEVVVVVVVAVGGCPRGGVVGKRGDEEVEVGCAVAEIGVVPGDQVPVENGELGLLDGENIRHYVEGCGVGTGSPVGPFIFSEMQVLEDGYLELI